MFGIIYNQFYLFVFFYFLCEKKKKLYLYPFKFLKIMIDYFESIRSNTIWYVCFQFWSAYVPCGAAQLNAVQLSLEQIDVIRRLAEMNAQHLTLVTSVKGE